MNAALTAARSGRHALIIEDEMLIALEVESLLHDFGFASCDIVDNSADAVKSALAHRPDLVTADLRIVGGTGVEAMDAITNRLGPVPEATGVGSLFWAALPKIFPVRRRSPCPKLKAA